MSEVMMEMMGPDAADMFGLAEMPQDEKMYVATVPDKIAGAGVIAYQNFMDEAAERLGGDFFILPSSLHEVLLVRDDCIPCLVLQYPVSFTSIESLHSQKCGSRAAPAYGLIL